MADTDLSQVFDEHGRAVFFCDHHVLDIIQAVDQTDPAHVIVLGADGQIVTPDVGVAVGQRGHDL
jgi:hypothetical protein